MHRIKVLLFMGILFVISLCSCSILDKKFNVNYDCKDFYEEAKDAYRVGTKVKLIYPSIASDTDYQFIVKGQDGTILHVDTYYDFNQGMVISFTMPKQDIYVKTYHRNSMFFNKSKIE